MIGTVAISGFEAVLLYSSNRGMKASFIFGHLIFSSKTRSAIAREVGIYTKIFSAMERAS
jgi:hypothetical protein